MQSLAQSLHTAGTHVRSGSVISIIDHIRRLMDSRRGQSLASPGYGLSISRCDMRDALTLLPQSLPHIERCVLQALEHNETRLHRWRLRCASIINKDTLVLHLAAQRIQSPHEALQFDIDISPLGRITVRS